MVRRHFEQLPGSRKAEILAIAAEQFAKDGFQGTSYNQLLARLGLGKGSAYYYFTDKQDLFLTVVKDCYRAFFDSVADLTEPASVDGYWSHIEVLNRRGLDFMVRDPTSAAVLHCFRNERERLSLLSAADVRGSLGQHYSALIALGQRLGAVRRDVPAELLTATAEAMLGACDQWFIGHARATRSTERALNARRFTELLRRLLEAAPPPREQALRTAQPLRRRQARAK